MFCVISERSLIQQNTYQPTAKSRKYQLTFNNPQQHGFSHEVIRTTLQTFSGLQYWCMCDEVGEQGTPHTHLYLFSPNAILFDTLQQRFHGAHIEPAKGSHQENRDYIRKEGKWLQDAKHETNLTESFEESGPLPPERNCRQTVSEEIFTMLQEDATDADILRRFPGAMNRLSNINTARQVLREEQYRNRFRQLKCTYLWGKTGVGKTRSILEKHGYPNVYRVSSYAHPFDGYRGQPVILFDEFRSSLPLGEMLQHLDGYPHMLSCRYADKVACYDTVYVVSNIPIEQQYPLIQTSEPESYKAFLRRFQSVLELSGDLAGCPF